MIRLHILLAMLLSAYAISASAAEEPEIVSVQKIWDQAPHNAFTDLIRYQDRWICSFREGKSHAGDRGNARLLTSDDGQTWVSLAELRHELYDLRDPKLSVMPDLRLMIVGGAVDVRRPGGVRFTELRTFVAFSSDARTWSSPAIVLGEWEWLWRVTWHEGIGYGVAYHVGLHAQTPRETRFGTLYRTRDGMNFEPVHQFRTPQGVGETTVRFDEHDTMHLVMRRDGGQRIALLGTSQPPYTEWNLKETGVHVGGPNLLRHPDSRWLIGTRTSTGGKTMLGEADFATGTIRKLLTLPSGGDSSYPGLVWHDGLLWMSYYSAHEGKASIYLARVRVP